jgi:hypothetical protein
VGDFGKYGLLRRLIGDDLSLGVVWYLTEAEEDNNDGRHAGYLNIGGGIREVYAQCDPALYHLMRECRGATPRHVNLIRERNVLPRTSFFADVVPTFAGNAGGPRGIQARWDQRQQWHEAAVQATKGMDVVFLDPDNGIESVNPVANRQGSPSHKHCYWGEINAYRARGQCVVVYHHLGRPLGGHEQYVQNCLTTFAQNNLNATAIRYRRGTSRVFFVFPAHEHTDPLAERVVAFSQDWQNHAGLITPPAV